MVCHQQAYYYESRDLDETFDLCILLSNALTNAIEAAGETAEAYIIVKGW
ncbi:MAG: GHKL domain-containing protein, partial [Lachnospiraceae bacterium]|nr:GHKL domain-containing protein [Lachnospiraceae bacterium]